MILISLGLLFFLLLLSGVGAFGVKKYQKMIKAMETKIEEQIKADYKDKIVAKDAEIAKLKMEKAEIIKKIKAKAGSASNIKPSATGQELKKSFQEMGYENH
jgi:signal transduction histidine kinase